jgi:hypothetical protein
VLKFVTPRGGVAEARCAEVLGALPALGGRNLLRCHEARPWRSGWLLVLDWQEGEPLPTWLDRHEHRRPRTAQAWQLFGEVAAGVEQVHRARSEAVPAHGGLTARCVLLKQVFGDRFAVSVMDHGIASVGVLPEGVDAGDLGAWLPPEATGGRAAVAPSGDVFALGVVLMELLTGDALARPDDRVTWARLSVQGPEALRRRVEELRPELRGAPLDAIVQAMHPDPACRYADAGAFRRALRQPDVLEAASRTRTASFENPHAVRPHAVAAAPVRTVDPQRTAAGPWGIGAPAPPMRDDALAAMGDDATTDPEPVGGWEEAAPTEVDSPGSVPPEWGRGVASADPFAEASATTEPSTAHGTLEVPTPVVRRGAPTVLRLPVAGRDLDEGEPPTLTAAPPGLDLFAHFTPPTDAITVPLERPAVTLPSPLLALPAAPPNPVPAPPPKPRPDPAALQLIGLALAVIAVCAWLVVRLR